MKRVFVLMMVALMSAVMVNAKTIHGYVSDKDGNPVVGMKMVIVNVDSPSRKSVAVTDEEGFFSVQVPDNLDTSDLVDMFASNGSRIIRYLSCRWHSCSWSVSPRSITGTLPGWTIRQRSRWKAPGGAGISGSYRTASRRPSSSLMVLN